MKNRNYKTRSLRINQFVALACLIFGLGLSVHAQTQESQKPATKQTDNAPQKEPSQEKPIEAKLVDLKQMPGIAL